MPRDLRVFLWDAIEAANQIQEFVRNLNDHDYSKNPMTKAAVERKFEIIGEALGQASRLSQKWRRASLTSSRLSPSEID